MPVERRTAVRIAAAVGAAWAALALPAAAGAVEYVDPAVQAELRFIDGYGVEDSARPSGAGDVDGDGHDDLLVTERYQYSLGRHATHGEIFFGPLPGGGVDVASTGVTPVSIQVPATAGADSLASVAAAGDVNGDGRADFVAQLGTDVEPAGVTVLFAKATRTSPEHGFDIPQGSEPTPLGDVDGDGLSDVAVMRWQAGADPRFYVVFGKASSSDVDLDALGAGGFQILAEPGPFGGLRLERAGDVDGDGSGDVIVDETHVLFGRPGGAPADPSRPGEAWRLGSEAIVRNAREAGDVNGDGFDDVLLQDRNGALVAFGSASPSTPRGFRVVFPHRSRFVQLNDVGDLDEDGFDDIVVDDAVLFGKADRSTLSTRSLRASKGFRVQPSLLDFDFDRSVSFGVTEVGDLTGTDRADLMFGPYLVSAPPHGDCTITGTPRGDVLVGTDGADMICGLGGNDRIDGGDGNDRIVGGEGSDAMAGGEGDDRIGGTDRVDAARGDAGADRLSGGAHRDGLGGGDGDDVADGGPGADTGSGGTGHDRLFGSGDADRLAGDEGDDVVHGGDGPDRLDGGDGADDLDGLGFPGRGPDRANLLRGGAGPDELLAGTRLDRLEGGPDADELIQGRIQLGGAGDDRLEGDEHSQRAFGGDGDDLLRGAGGDATNGGRDLLDGGAGNDRLIDNHEGGGYVVPGPDPDRLLGGSGEDDLTGGFGDDLADGGAGNDVVRGGSGRDRLRGGADDDELLSAGDGVRDHDACGAGLDTVRFDAGIDVVARDCEVRNP